jgi:hypothetical protein
MRATDHLQQAFYIGMTGQDDIQKQWINVMYKIGGLAGQAHMISIASNNRIDLLLRTLEQEWLEQLRSGSPTDEGISADIMISLAEIWVLRSYEIIRAAAAMARREGQTYKKLDALYRRLGLVRVPIAKAQIKSVKSSKPMLDVLGGDRDPRPYENDGSYIIPRAVCAATGSIMWHAVDIDSMETVEIRRRELSNEFLLLFED